MNRRRTHFAVIFFLYLLTPSISLEFHKPKHKIKSPIKTFAVLVMENRSFDHILGWLKKTRPDGLTGKESKRINASDPNSPEVFVTDDAVFIDSDSGHSIQAIREQIFGSNNSSADPAPMNGFVRQVETMETGRLSRTVISGFKPEVLPVTPS